MRASIIAGVSAAILALASGPMASTAFATPLSGTFNISVYQGPGNGSAADPNNQAQRGNPLINPGNLLSMFTYTGPLNFNAPSQPQNTLAQFIASGGGTTTPSPLANGSTILSTASFGTTSVFDITGTTGGLNLVGNVLHDDGASLYQGANTIFSSPAPTSVVPPGDAYTLPAGTFELIYVEANGAPSVLDFNVTSSSTPVPEPASLALLGTGLIGLGMVARRRKVL